jgi:hypothetical protein
VLDASPLIVLARVGQLGLLERLATEVWIPPAVAMEIRSGPQADPARQALEAGWGQAMSCPDADAQVLEWSLGPGETEVISMARRAPGSTAVLDDAVARHCGRALGIPLVGTLGVIIRARRGGLLDCAADVLKSLRSAGMYLDDELVNKVLHQVGER